jgi:hypothetical protein
MPLKNGVAVGSDDAFLLGIGFFDREKNFPFRTKPPGKICCCVEFGARWDAAQVEDHGGDGFFGEVAERGVGLLECGGDERAGADVADAAIQDFGKKWHGLGIGSLGLVERCPRAEAGQKPLQKGPLAGGGVERFGREIIFFQCLDGFLDLRFVEGIDRFP